ncbi:MAG: mechanosensitive ion channel family protein [Desulfurococcales archaeon]|nr:mechanosensitive ion channel family protein [Desulfurococcales archaeon]
MAEAVKIVGGELEVLGFPIPLSIINSIITLILMIVFLAIYRRVLRRLVTARVLDRLYYEKLYRVTELIVFVITLLTVTYFLTGEHALIYVIAGLILIVAAASWQIIASIVSFYILLFSRIIGRGDNIILPGGPQGRVREINLLYTVLETSQGLYAVPNLEIVKSGRLLLKDITHIRVVARVWGFEDPSVVPDIKASIQEALEEMVRELAVHGAVPRIYIDEVSMESATFKTIIPVTGPRPNLVRVSDVLVVLANALKELGYSYTITLEHPEGYEQRWRTIG